MIEPPLGVAGHRVLDLDDVGPPVDEHRPAGGDEHPAGDLDDADAVERSGHVLLLVRRQAGQPTVLVSVKISRPSMPHWRPMPDCL